MMRRAYCLLVLFSLSACSTPYQPNGFTGGYQEQQIAADQFIVSARGNAMVSMDNIKLYTLRRSAELSVHNGYKFFTIIEGSEDYYTGYMTTPGTYQSTTTGSAYGSTQTQGTY